MLLSEMRLGTLMVPELTRGQGLAYMAKDLIEVIASLWVNFPVFQTEIYAILQCEYKNIKRAYKNKQILICSDSQAALKALSGPKVTSTLVAERLDALLALASHNEVTLVWVPEHQSILGNEQADKLARQASAMPILSPKPALGIPKCLAREAIKNWTEHQQILPGKIHLAVDKASFS